MSKATYAKLSHLLDHCGLGLLNIDEYLNNWKFQVALFKKMNEQQKALCRVYMIDGYNFVEKDLFSKSDPYLVLRSGKDVFSEKANYQLDTSEPQFFKSYDFVNSFPGAHVLHIEAYDYDDFFGDELIGGTKIDLDDRFFNKTWTSVFNKPIETRQLYCEGASVSQGAVRLWCEITPMESRRSTEPPLDISPEPPHDYEVRLIVWKTEDIEMMDFEGTSDVYVRSFLDPEKDHLTDTHWRCQTGKASFNWRNLIPVQTKQPGYNLTIQAWDKDIIASDDLIGEFTLDIEPLIREAHLLDKIRVLNQEYWETRMKGVLEERGGSGRKDLVWDTEESKPSLNEKFWVPVRRTYDEEKDKEGGKKPDEDGLIVTGKIQCSLRVYPAALAEKHKQGRGRSEPNDDPACPEPEGRIKLTLNPFEMLAQLVGPALRRKIMIALCLLACLTLTVYMIPMILSNGISKAIFG